MEAAAIAGEFAPGLGRKEEAPPMPVSAPGTKRGRGRPPKGGSPAPGASPIEPGPKAAPPKSSPIKDAIDKGLPWFRENDVLSEREAAALYEPLKAALADYFDYADEYIWYRCKDAAKEPVWSNGDDDELSAIARLMIKRGKRSAGAATVVRAIVNGDDYVTTAVFFVPRMVETQRRLRAAPKRERRNRRAH